MVLRFCSPLKKVENLLESSAAYLFHIYLYISGNFRRSCYKSDWLLKHKLDQKNDE